MRLKKETGRILGVFILISGIFFSSYITIFLASAKANASLQSIRQVFDSSIHTITMQNLRIPDSFYDAMSMSLDEDSIRAAITRFNNLNSLLWFKEASQPSATLAIRWQAWRNTKIRGTDLRDLASQTADRELIQSFEEANSILNEIGKKVRTAFDLLFLTLGFILSVGTAGSVAFYADLRQSRMKQQLMQDSFRLALSAEENTNKSVAMQLHDDVAQDIAAARMLCERIAVSKDLSLSEKASGILGEVNIKIRNLSANLWPPELKTLGLGAALTGLCVDMELRFNYPIAYSGDAFVPRMPEFVELNIYRIMREAAVNASKHANKGGAILQCGKENPANGMESLFFILKDEGFSHADGTSRLPPSRADGLGMNAMKERAASIGADLQIHLHGEGSLVRLTVPIKMKRSFA